MRLGPARQPSGKVIHAWAIEAGALDPAAIKSGTFDMEWPPRSGRTAAFPEVDRAAWFNWDEAQVKILVGQKPILERLKARLEDAITGA
jgi:predicted NUDIX family NTP pyrophosphohydrolase